MKEVTELVNPDMTLNVHSFMMIILKGFEIIALVVVLLTVPVRSMLYVPT
jgi:hypothetical protein